MDYEALARQYGGTPSDSSGPLTLDNAAQRIPGGAPAVDAEKLARAYGGKEAGDLTPLQGAGAVATGFNHSILATLPGLPVKAALDVADLARAAYGTAGRATGFLTPDEMPAPLNRAGYVGSPEWFNAQLQRTPVTSALVTNPRGDNPAARILNSGGAALGASLAGRPSDMAMQFASGVAGQGANEAGAPPALSILASMGPQGAQSGAFGATRGMMRGGEAGRQEMENRTTQFQNAGVQPTVGLASGQRLPQAIESFLAKTPGGAGVIANKVGGMQDQMAATANAARDQVSTAYGPGSAGDVIKRGITDYRERQQGIYGRMLDGAISQIPPGMTFPISGMLTRGDATIPQIPGAPNVSRVLQQPLGYTRDVLGALQKDAAPTPPGSTPSPILQASGLPFTTPTAGTPGGLPFAGIQGLRSNIGAQAYATNPLMADANTGALKSLYGGAKQDLMGAAALADAQRVANGQRPGVLPQLQRADRFYNATQDILSNVLAPIYKAGDAASEKSFYRMEGDLRNSGQTVTRAMSSLPLDARRQFAATVVDRIGKATPGQQNAEGSAFSPQTFLTNWNRIAPDARNAVLHTIPGGINVRAKLDALAQAASYMRDANKVYANPSGTAPAATLLGSGAGIMGGAIGAATGHPGAGLATLGTVLSSMAAANVTARTMTNPRFVNWLSQSTSLSPARLEQHAMRLSQMSAFEGDPEQRAAMRRLGDELTMELRAGRTQ